jgi:chromosome segregation ATPase
LRESNDAAQDWMSKAVEHHQMLSEQVAFLTNENAALKAETKALNENLLPFQASALLTDQEQEEKSAEIEPLVKFLSNQEKEMEAHHVSTIEALKAEMALASQELEMLRAQMAQAAPASDYSVAELEM